MARALLAVAMDQRKHSGEENALASALELAKAELSYFQGRVEHAKRIKNTDAAVNLGISTKRLLFRRRSRDPPAVTRRESSETCKAKRQSVLYCFGRHRIRTRRRKRAGKPSTTFPKLRC